MLFDYAIGDGETEACTCSNFLCSEKRVEDALLKTCWYTRTRITKMNIHDISLNSAGDRDHLLRHVSQSIPSIRQQINEDLFHLYGIANHDHIFRGKT